ncbi:Wzy polymerase domain-containing protein [Serratia rubidaea]|uniref:O-antigen ligase family protein n=1 Tax=Serratia rubidaea TaxID=61652 RepID=A0ABS0MFQ1_SERRU|nr:Wzy polymerase domain-containing protein [Serratia rubidaea]AML56696.1 Lipid A core-O-antigen ligase [Serratia rubidaea]MBH1931200.1 O-antigen ligase family protein [Serratia rubidaea]MDC6117162.1 Wzy polymerase domain-containing protein [Serratia rubidaea]
MHYLTWLPLHHRHYYHWLPLGIMVFWLLFIIPIYLPNMGGSGLKLPQNIISWGVMAATIAAIWLSIRTKKTFRLTATVRWIILAVVILAIPLIYTPHQWREMALTRWLALVGGLVFYISLLQYSALQRCLPWLLYSILAASTLQAGIAILQFIIPDTIPIYFAYPQHHGRPYGVFQQVNVLASFIATGLMLALLLLLSPSFSLSTPQAERARQYILGLLLLIFPALLVWLQSRIGWLSGLISCTLLLLLGWKTARVRTLTTIGIIGLSITFAIFFKLGGNIIDIEHVNSNHARLIMLKTTLGMITEKPWQGWGYGGFEYNFQHYRMAQGLSTLGLGIVTHPHNELLFWWAEGGVVALIGMLILIYIGARFVWRICRPVQYISQQQIFLARALICTLLPILLHCQTEYPFTLSSAHWVIFLLLLAQLDQLTNNVTEHRLATAVIANMLIALSATGVLIFAFGLYANLTLTTAEREHLVNIEPARAAMKYDLWMNTERWHYDQQTHALLVFNQTRNPALLSNYTHWAKNYLSKRIDKNVYATWLAITQYQQDAHTHHRLRQEAHSLFPDDVRFFPPFILQRPDSAL